MVVCLRRLIQSAEVCWRTYLWTPTITDLVSLTNTIPTHRITNSSGRFIHLPRSRLALFKAISRSHLLQLLNKVWGGKVDVLAMMHTPEGSLHEQFPESNTFVTYGIRACFKNVMSLYLSSMPMWILTGVIMGHVEDVSDPAEFTNPPRS